jgi:hypothetical protein
MSVVSLGFFDTTRLKRSPPLLEQTNNDNTLFTKSTQSSQRRVPDHTYILGSTYIRVRPHTKNSNTHSRLESHMDTTNYHTGKGKGTLQGKTGGKDGVGKDWRSAKEGYTHIIFV